MVVNAHAELCKGIYCPSGLLRRDPSNFRVLCLSVCLSVRPSVCLSVCPSVRLSVRLSVRPSVTPKIELKIIKKKNNSSDIQLDQANFFFFHFNVGQKLGKKVPFFGSQFFNQKKWKKTKKKKPTDKKSISSLVYNVDRANCRFLTFQSWQKGTIFLVL